MERLTVRANGAAASNRAEGGGRREKWDRRTR
jgi:hypothetical protein